MDKVKRYRHIFFDLDHTLWDYDRNARETLNELFELYQLQQLTHTSFDSFYQIFQEVNFDLWAKFNRGEVDRTMIRRQRFQEILSRIGLHDEDLAARVSHDYIQRCPNKRHLVQDALSLLDYLKPRYDLHVITNGFEDVQYRKLKQSGLREYFQVVVTSERSHSQKPEKRIFQFALQEAEATPQESIMIGDNIDSDITGAFNVNMDAVYYNHHESMGRTHTALHEVRTLREIMRLL